MFTIKSFQANGQLVEHVGQAVGFVGLYLNGQLVEYFTSVQAARYSADAIEAWLTREAETTVFELKQAA